MAKTFVKELLISHFLNMPMDERFVYELFCAQPVLTVSILCSAICPRI